MPDETIKGGEALEGSTQEPAPAESAEDVGSLAGPSVEQLRSELEGLKQQLAHSQETIGRQGEELGYLRQLREVYSKPQEAPGETLPSERFSIQVSDDEVMDLLEKPGATFSRLGSRLYENIMEQVEEVVAEALSTERYRTSIAETFYQNHPELLEHRALVGVIADAVQRRNPNKAPHELLEEVAKDTKTYLSSIRGTKAGETVVGGTGATKIAPSASKEDVSSKELRKALEFVEKR